MQRFFSPMSAGDPTAPSFVAAASAGWEAPAVTDMNAAAKTARLKHLEEQAAESLKLAVASGKKVVFPNALIAGDAVITHLLYKYELLPKVSVLAVDTLHLFPETLDFLKSVEDAYGFKAHISMAEGITGYGAEAKAMYDKKYGADLWQTNIEEYDRLCKVEPFQRGLKTLGAEVIITGRTRWQGNERAWLDIYEAPKKAGGLGNCNPLAYWTLEDTFDYIAANKILHHPLHAKGYPSIGDAKDTIPIPEDGSVIFKDFKFTGDKTEWLGYALERKGRFVGLKNKDGSTKTECGIHVSGAEKTWDRDLWDKSVTVKEVESEEGIKSIKDSSLVVVYAPWCQFCQAMEESFEATSKDPDMGSFKFLKFRGDTRREFVQANLQTQSFPTIGFMKNGKFLKYESEDRSVAALRRFVKESDESIALNE
jgi:phosphoadenosine phosphosulfate reductase